MKAYLMVIFGGTAMILSVGAEIPLIDHNMIMDTLMVQWEEHGE